MGTVLVVDRDATARRAIMGALRYGGFDSETVGTVKEAGRRLGRHDYAGIIVDPGDESVTTRLAELRARTDAPIIVVTECQDRLHSIECLDAGADDYVRRPFDPEELLARLRAVQRRVATDEGAAPVVTTDFTVDIAGRRLTRADGTDVSLSPIEWKLVEVLVHRSGHLVPREELLTTVWGPGAVEKSQYLRVHMASIRQKVEPDPARPRYFVTAPGLGLKFDPEAPVSVDIR
jgi:two-component system KDP operon response regulator KdpE